MTKNILILYGSTTGNTESLGKYIAKNLISMGYQITFKNVAYITEEYIFSDDFHLIILCCSTWGTDAPCLQEDFEIFWKKTLKSSLKGKNIALFGTGDKYYPSFCAAVDILTKDILTYQGNLILEGMKIQDPWEDSITKILSTLNKVKESYL